MKRIPFICLLVISIYGWGQKELKIPGGKIPDGYYMSTNGFFLLTYVKVSEGKVYADYVFRDKFPRDLYSETLLPAGSDSSYVGPASRLYVENGKYYITVEKKKTIFRVSKIRLKYDEKGYKAGIEKNRNQAVFYRFHDEYRDANKEDKNAMSRFWNFYDKKHFGQEIEKLKHEEFLVLLEQYKMELAATR
jgi:hypothetical protein